MLPFCSSNWGAGLGTVSVRGAVEDVETFTLLSRAGLSWDRTLPVTRGSWCGLVGCPSAELTGDPAFQFCSVVCCGPALTGDNKRASGKAWIRLGEPHLVVLLWATAGRLLWAWGGGPCVTPLQVEVAVGCQLWAQ